MSVTWNPVDTNSNIALSGGDLTLTKSGGGNGYAGSRATMGKSSGKWYWEVLVVTGNTSPFITIGVANASASLSNYTGADANGWCYYQETGNKITNGSGTAYGAAYGSTDNVGILLNMDDGELSFRKNNADQGLAFTGLSGTLFPTVALWRSDSPAHQVVGKFAASDLTYSVPAGYSVLA